MCTSVTRLREELTTTFANISRVAARISRLGEKYGMLGALKNGPYPTGHNGMQVGINYKYY